MSTETTTLSRDAIPASEQHELIEMLKDASDDTLYALLSQAARVLLVRNRVRQFEMEAEAEGWTITVAVRAVSP